MTLGKVSNYIICRVCGRGNTLGSRLCEKCETLMYTHREVNNE